jgi:hypothetical protein
LEVLCLRSSFHTTGNSSINVPPVHKIFDHASEVS